MNDQFRALILMLLVLFALIAIALAILGCTINVERVQVGPDNWGPTTQPQTIVEIP